MNRTQWKSEYRSARLGRRRGTEGLDLLGDGSSLRLPGMRRRAAWAFVGLAMVAATLAFWRAEPGAQRGEALAVSVPAASSPAADEGPSAIRS
jgi:hypothetical protein